MNNDMAPSVRKYHSITIVLFLLSLGGLLGFFTSPITDVNQCFRLVCAIIFSCLSLISFKFVEVVDIKLKQIQ